MPGSLLAFASMLVALQGTSPVTDSEIALCVKSAEFIDKASRTGQWANTTNRTILTMRSVSGQLLARYVDRTTGPGAAAFDQLGRAEFNRKFGSGSTVQQIWEMVQACTPAAASAS
ncbi:hypothetical protein BWQ93_11655 [Sphingopyxis sp. QXT-31]|uniref:hypothetical protein n=1 Tax=Sphingopyxis sp. QXT-31 TaxID=1357916 RepID=UPI0009796E7C|nr:hypothetical protein [Sphingopyxis sp. QXT-31]APZ99072.1 hypothetical protein BWQ93_11655 [Sphingopyxis sp. QXT-31]